MSYVCQDFEERRQEFERLCKIELEFMQRTRAAQAERIREGRRYVRKLLASNPVNPRLRLKLLHAFVRDCHIPLKPSRRNLLNAAKANLNYSRSRWSNPYDSEYYSACGYDDYMSDSRHHAKRKAAMYYRIWRHLGGAAWEGPL